MRFFGFIRVFIGLVLLSISVKSGITVNPGNSIYPAGPMESNPIQVQLTSTIDDRIEPLQQIGKSFLASRNYKRASPYYGACLQLLEGLGGLEPRDLRLRCCLTLAYCDLKRERFYNAIARCSEIIEELPVPAPIDDESIRSIAIEHRVILGKAFYRRGLSLEYIELPNLAVVDLNIANKLIPNDKRILGKLNELMKENNELIGENTTVISSADNITNNMVGLWNCNGSIQSVPSSIYDQILIGSNYIEDLQNIVEYSQNVSLSKTKYFTPQDIDSLLHLHSTAPKKSESAQSLFSSWLPSGSSKSTSQGSGDIFNSLSGVSGEGIEGSLLGGLLGAGLGKGSPGMSWDKLEMFKPIIQQLTGIDSSTLNNIFDVGKAIVVVSKLFSTVFKFVIRNSGLIFGFLWLALTLLHY